MLGEGLPGRHKRHYSHFQPVRAWGTEPGIGGEDSWIPL